MEGGGEGGQIKIPPVYVENFQIGNVVCKRKAQYHINKKKIIPACKIKSQSQ